MARLSQQTDGSLIFRAGSQIAMKGRYKCHILSTEPTTLQTFQEYGLRFATLGKFQR
jgi:hypothetical protein